jgi:hypothetical protein
VLEQSTPFVLFITPWIALFLFQFVLRQAIFSIEKTVKYALKISVHLWHKILVVFIKYYNHENEYKRQATPNTSTNEVN